MRPPGHLVSVERLPELPADFAAQPPQTDARFVFFAGAQNRCFLPESQQRTYRAASTSSGPATTRSMCCPSYSHLDVFMGKNAARDVFPLMLDELEL